MFRHSEKRQNLIAQQKVIFMNGGEVDRSIVDATIESSWKRSRDHNVAPDLLERSKLSDNEIQKLLHENEELLSCSHEVLSHMFSFMEESVSALSIANADGVTLYISNRPEHASFYPDAVVGGINTEAMRGTNGIGTCLVCQAPVEIIGAEHYRLASRCWSCSAAPIFSPDNKLLGVLNVTQLIERYHVHTFGMVKAAATAIMEHLRFYRIIQQREIIMEKMNTGVMLISAAGKIEVLNNKAAQLLGIDKHQPLPLLSSVIPDKKALSFLQESRGQEEDQEFFFRTDNGLCQCFVDVNLLSDGSHIVNLRESHQVRKTASKIVGAEAVYTFERILGLSEKLTRVLSLARKVARSQTTVLLLGESGTGKELFAQAIHNASNRAEKPFVTVNCGAIPHDLVESELFGYDRGAFTGANSQGKLGKFELADGGTIFLDEIGEMPLDSQVSLLRLLQNGEVTRVGGKVSRSISVRIIAATNKDLATAVKENSFREDLYYRLNVFPIVLPPLRERKEDISILAHHFLHYFTRKFNSQIKGFTSGALDRLIRYDWPGNIRELENIVERMVNIVSDEDHIDINHIPLPLQEEQKLPVQKSRGMLFLQEKQSIIETLELYNGNMRKAAENLGISRGGLYMKVKRFGIDVKKLRKNSF